MDNKIDIERIALDQFEGWTHCEKVWIKNAMIEFGEQLLELAFENAKIDISMYYPNTKREDYIQEVICDHYHDREWHLSVNKESIIDTIEEIKSV